MVFIDELRQHILDSGAASTVFADRPDGAGVPTPGDVPIVSLETSQSPPAKLLEGFLETRYVRVHVTARTLEQAEYVDAQIRALWCDKHNNYMAGGLLIDIC